MPVLRRFAAGCDHVTEMGVRGVVSSWAFLAARVKRLVCYDIARTPNVDAFERLAKVVTNFSFHEADVLHVNIEETDLLFIDTYHTYGQLRAELARHAPRVRKFLAFHDTVTFGEVGEDGKRPGIRQAIDELVAQGKWAVLLERSNNNGLTVLRRVGG